MTDPDAFSTEAFRGEHGKTPLMSHLGSWSFVDSIAVAAYYAHNPNAPHREVGTDQRVLHCQLTWDNLLVNTPNDPFIEFSDLEAKVGFDCAKRLMLRHAGHVMDTSAWEESFSSHYPTVQALVDAEPGRLRELYVLLWPLLDTPESVADLKAAGVDGAIHRGSGLSMNAVEYRVFDPTQVAVLGSYLPPAVRHDETLEGKPLSLAELQAVSPRTQRRGPKP